MLHELHRRIEQGTSLAILDVGIVGSQPLEFWEPLLTRYVGSFHMALYPHVRRA